MQAGRVNFPNPAGTSTESSAGGGTGSWAFPQVTSASVNFARSSQLVVVSPDPGVVSGKVTLTGLTAGSASNALMLAMARVLQSYLPGVASSSDVELELSETAALSFSARTTVRGDAVRVAKRFMRTTTTTSSAGPSIPFVAAVIADLAIQAGSTEAADAGKALQGVTSATLVLEATRTTSISPPPTVAAVIVTATGPDAVLTAKVGDSADSSVSIVLGGSITHRGKEGGGSDSQAAALKKSLRSQWRCATSNLDMADATLFLTPVLNSLDLVIRPGVLDAGIKYAFSLAAWYNDGASSGGGGGEASTLSAPLEGFSTISFTTNLPPSGGSLIVSTGINSLNGVQCSSSGIPTKSSSSEAVAAEGNGIAACGYSVWTEWEARIERAFVDAPGHLPLRYAFSYMWCTGKTGEENDISCASNTIPRGVATAIGDVQFDSQTSFVLPAPPPIAASASGNSSTNVLLTNNARIIVTAIDQLGAKALVSATVAVALQAPSSNGTVANKALEGAKQAEATAVVNAVTATKAASDAILDKTNADALAAKTQGAKIAADVVAADAATGKAEADQIASDDAKAKVEAEKAAYNAATAADADPGNKALADKAATKKANSDAAALKSKASEVAADAAAAAGVVAKAAVEVALAKAEAAAATAITANEKVAAANDKVASTNAAVSKAEEKVKLSIVKESASAAAVVAASNAFLVQLEEQQAKVQQALEDGKGGPALSRAAALISALNGLPLIPLSAMTMDGTDAAGPKGDERRANVAAALASAKAMFEAREALLDQSIQATSFLPVSERALLMGAGVTQRLTAVPESVTTRMRQTAASFVGSMIDGVQDDPTAAAITVEAGALLTNALSNLFDPRLGAGVPAALSTIIGINNGGSNATTTNSSGNASPTAAVPGLTEEERAAKERERRRVVSTVLLKAVRTLTSALIRDHVVGQDAVNVVSANIRFMAQRAFLGAIEGQSLTASAEMPTDRTQFMFTPGTFSGTETNATITATTTATSSESDGASDVVVVSYDNNPHGWSGEGVASMVTSLEMRTVGSLASLEITAALPQPVIMEIPIFAPAVDVDVVTDTGNGHSGDSSRGNTSGIVGNNGTTALMNTKTVKVLSNVCINVSLCAPPPSWQSSVATAIAAGATEVADDTNTSAYSIITSALSRVYGNISSSGVPLNNRSFAFFPAKCVYWDVVGTNWSSTGCTEVGLRRDNVTGDVFLRCACTHLTDFAAKVRTARGACVSSGTVSTD